MPAWRRLRLLEFRGVSDTAAAVRGIRAAFVFLSRVPVGGFPYSPAAWCWAPAWFPLVGLSVGVVAAVAFSLTNAVTNVAIAAVIAVAVSVLMTGAFHEDGLADTADALGGAHGHKQMLDILKDSRIGTYGALALLISLLLRLACIASLAELAPGALVAAHVLARTGPVWLIATMSYVTESNAKGSAVGAAGIAQAVVATVLAGLISVLLAIFGYLSARSVIVAVLAAVGLTATAGWYFKRRAGGITGDFLGATEQICELGVFLSVVVVASS